MNAGEIHAPGYVGRFAPSPTGPLHFGSLVAALASWLDARAAGGRWLLRIDDLDRPRCTAQAEGEILRALETFGLHHDGPVVRQHTRDAAYAAALERLRAAGCVYACACTRRELADSRLGADGSAIYPGTCRPGLPPGRSARAWRYAVGDDVIEFDDRIQGHARIALATDCGDFLVRRADDLFAYQLAAVVDDFDAGVSEIVRGADLFQSTARQIALQRALGLPTPRYAHVPAAVNAAGEKLSKQTRAAPLDIADVPATLCRTLRFLGQAPPPDLAAATGDDVLAWARDNWRLERIPRSFTQPTSGAPC